MMLSGMSDAERVAWLKEQIAKLKAAGVKDREQRNAASTAASNATTDFPGAEGAAGTGGAGD